jgi:hypothetical protein
MLPLLPSEPRRIESRLLALDVDRAAAGRAPRARKHAYDVRVARLAEPDDTAVLAMGYARVLPLAVNAVGLQAIQDASEHVGFIRRR